MDQNLPKTNNKVQTVVHTIFMMLKKSISKSKLDLTMMIKRGKIAGKSFQNLLFHHHHHNWPITAVHRHANNLTFLTPPPGEYEFSCSTTPPYPLSLFSAKKKDKHRVIHGPQPLDLDDDFRANADVMKALEMLTSATSSPAVWQTPVGKRLRITDSPFPLVSGDEDGEVDEAADKFIMRFYNDLSRQK